MYVFVKTILSLKIEKRRHLLIAVTYQNHENFMRRSHDITLVSKNGNLIQYRDLLEYLTNLKIFYHKLISMWSSVFNQKFKKI